MARLNREEPYENVGRMPVWLAARECVSDIAIGKSLQKSSTFLSHVEATGQEGSQTACGPLPPASCSNLRCISVQHLLDSLMPFHR
jgi:hypothetical protein